MKFSSAFRCTYRYHSRLNTTHGTEPKYFLSTTAKDEWVADFQSNNMTSILDTFINPHVNIFLGLVDKRSKGKATRRVETIQKNWIKKKE
jgi:hypothetical protein